MFGLLGVGNLGNDGSFEALLSFVRAEHPDAAVDCMCAGPDSIAARYGIPTTPLHWNTSEYTRASGPGRLLAKGVAKIMDAFRIVSWVRRHDVVMVPGMGVLEATLPLRPWGFPYMLLWLAVAGRLCGTTVALVCVGADVVTHRTTRLMITTAARLVHYRSYRDVLSREAMRQMGVDVRGDEVYPDLAFGLPTPTATPATSRRVVGVGVMAFHGGNDERARAEEIHRAYRDGMTAFVLRLLDDGRDVRLFTGDRVDDAVVSAILAAVRADRPGMARSRVVAPLAATLPELMAEMAEVDLVVATRYHNVLCAVRLAKPTVSVGYATKNEVLMTDMGLDGFCASARAVTEGALMKLVQSLEARQPELVSTMNERNDAHARRLGQQFAALSALLSDDHRLAVPWTAR